MPYGARDKLPSNVAKASAKQQRQWRHVFNGEYATHGDESRAFASANSVLGKATSDTKDMFYPNYNDGTEGHFGVNMAHIADETPGVPKAGRSGNADQPKSNATGTRYMDAPDDTDHDESDERTSYNKATPEAAGYSATGAANGHGCATCMFFDGEDGCAIVSGPIAPLGLSRLYVECVDANYADDLIGVDNDGDADDTNDTGVKAITEYDSGQPSMGSHGSAMGRLAKKVAGKVKSFFPVSHGEAFEYPPMPASGMLFFKDANDRLRFLATVTNNFRDREKELLTEEAHREYIAWADAKGIYPELWLWHAGSKSRWGQADWLDYCDGFVIASGTVDDTEDALAIAASVKEDEANIAVSHGFLSAKADKEGLIHKYRMFELSPLPTWAAANEWTGFSFIDDGSIETMPFSAAKATWLKGKGFNDKSIAAMEASLGNIAKEVMARGIDYKDLSDFFVQGKADNPADVSGTVNPSVANPSGIHHPHTAQLAHYHYHMDGTYHEHAHGHGDGSVGHDTDEHASMSGKSLGEHIKAVADANALLGTKAVTNANKSKPSEYADVPDDKFLDAANWKYPFDSSHIKAAESYFNHDGQREAGGYSESQWAAMGGKLASALGAGYSYSNGKVVNGSAGSSKDLSDLRQDLALLSKAVSDLTMVVSRQSTPGATSAAGSGASPGIPPVQTKGADAPPAPAPTAAPAGVPVDAQGFPDFVTYFNQQDARMGGFQASASSDNTLTKSMSDAAKKEYDAENKDGWFGETVLGSLNGIMANAPASR